MKRIIMLCAVLAGFVVGAQAQVASQAPSIEALKEKYAGEMLEGRKAPDFALQNLEGQTVSLDDLRGKVVVIDFWATWCKPCIASFPGMQATIEKYKDDKEVVFLFLDVLEQQANYKEVVKSFLQNNGYAFEVLFDDMKSREKSTTKAYNVNAIPNKVVIDKEGYIRFQSAGSGRDIDGIVAEMTAKITLAKEA